MPSFQLRTPDRVSLFSCVGFLFRTRGSCVPVSGSLLLSHVNFTASEPTLLKKKQKTKTKPPKHVSATFQFCTILMFLEVVALPWNLSLCTVEHTMWPARRCNRKNQSPAVIPHLHSAPCTLWDAVGLCPGAGACGAPRWCSPPHPFLLFQGSVARGWMLGLL